MITDVQFLCFCLCCQRFYCAKSADFRQQMSKGKGSAHPCEWHNGQRLNFGMKIECCCCEQPISNQKIILTAFSLGAHNTNIRFPSQNSASANESWFRILAYLLRNWVNSLLCGCDRVIKEWIVKQFTLSHRNTNFTIERGRALFVEWTGLVSIISPESFIISPRADYETHNQP